MGVCQNTQMQVMANHIIITNSQTSRTAHSLNSVVTSRGVPAYCILLSIPRDHGTSTQFFDGTYVTKIYVYVSLG